MMQKKAEGTTDDRKISRGFDLIDHSADGTDNFQTIAGGKLSIFRLMAERVSDQLCIRLKIDAPCRTRHEPLPSTLNCEWTEPGLAPKTWLEKQQPDDIILCECEMVPKSAVQSILDNSAFQKDSVLLHNIGARSRIGKGACQGTYCGLRLTAHLYDRGAFQQDQGIADLKHFSNTRWNGQRAVLFGEQLKVCGTGVSTPLWLRNLYVRLVLAVQHGVVLPGQGTQPDWEPLDRRIIAR